MKYHLVVTRHWGDYAPGMIITDPETVSSILGGERVHDVVKIAAPAEADPAPASDTPQGG